MGQWCNVRCAKSLTATNCKCEQIMIYRITTNSKRGGDNPQSWFVLNIVCRTTIMSIVDWIVCSNICSILNGWTCRLNWNMLNSTKTVISICSFTVDNPIGASSDILFSPAKFVKSLYGFSFAFFISINSARCVYKHPEIRAVDFNSHGKRWFLAN